MRRELIPILLVMLPTACERSAPPDAPPASVAVEKPIAELGSAIRARRVDELRALRPALKAALDDYNQSLKKEFQEDVQRVEARNKSRRSEYESQLKEIQRREAAKAAGAAALEERRKLYNAHKLRVDEARTLAAEATDKASTRQMAHQAALSDLETDRFVFIDSFTAHAERVTGLPALLDKVTEGDAVIEKAESAEAEAQAELERTAANFFNAESEAAADAALPLYHAATEKVREARHSLLKAKEARRTAWVTADRTASELMSWATKPPRVSSDAVELDAAIAAHAIAIRAYATSWSESISAERKAEAASVALETAEEKSRAANSAALEAKKRWRRAKSKYDTIDDLVRGQETMRRMGARVNIDYAARNAAADELQTAKSASEKAEKEKSTLRKQVTDAAKLKATALAASKALGRKSVSDREAMKTSAETISSLTTVWKAEREEASDRVAAAKGAWEVALAAKKAADSTLLALGRELSDLGSEVRTLERASEQFDWGSFVPNAPIAEEIPAPPSYEHALADIVAAVDRCIATSLSGESIRAFLALMPTLSSSQVATMRVWVTLRHVALAIKEDIDGPR